MPSGWTRAGVLPYKTKLLMYVPALIANAALGASKHVMLFRSIDYAGI